jgi:hypothetical protein
VCVRKDKALGVYSTLGFIKDMTGSFGGLLFGHDTHDYTKGCLDERVDIVCWDVMTGEKE